MANMNIELLKTWIWKTLDLPKCIKDEALEHFAVNRNEIETHGDRKVPVVRLVSNNWIFYSFIKRVKLFFMKGLTKSFMRQLLFQRELAERLLRKSKSYLTPCLKVRRLGIPWLDVLMKAGSQLFNLEKIQSQRVSHIPRRLFCYWVITSLAFKDWKYVSINMNEVLDNAAQDGPEDILDLSIHTY